MNTRLKRTFLLLLQYKMQIFKECPLYQATDITKTNNDRTDLLCVFDPFSERRQSTLFRFVPLPKRANVTLTLITLAIFSSRNTFAGACRTELCYLENWESTFFLPFFFFFFFFNSARETSTNHSTSLCKSAVISERADVYIFCDTELDTLTAGLGNKAYDKIRKCYDW